jgi:hypothetical protein
MVIGLVLPHLWASVVGSTSLSVHQSLLGKLGNVEITKLDTLIAEHEHVSTFQVPMVDSSIV